MFCCFAICCFAFLLFSCVVSLFAFCCFVMLFCYVVLLLFFCFAVSFCYVLVCYFVVSYFWAMWLCSGVEACHSARGCACSFLHIVGPCFLLVVSACVPFMLVFRSCCILIFALFCVCALLLFFRNSRTLSPLARVDSLFFLHETTFTPQVVLNIKRI